MFNQRKKRKGLPYNWIIDFILKNGTVKIPKACKVLTCRNGENEDGSMEWKISDGYVFAKAIITKEAMAKYFEDHDESSLPEWNGSILLLRQYQLNFEPHPIEQRSVFSIVVDKFVLWSAHHNFRRKHIIENCMEDPQVQLCVKAAWNAWREKSRKDSMSQMSVNSIPLSQLLAEMENQSDGEETSEQPDGIEPTTSKLSQEQVAVLKKRPVSVMDFIICDKEMEFLNSIEEWKEDFQPPASGSTGSEKLRSMGSSQSTPAEHFQGPTLINVSGNSSDSSSPRLPVKLIVAAEVHRNAENSDVDNSGDLLSSKSAADVEQRGDNELSTEKQGKLSLVHHNAETQQSNSSTHADDEESIHFTCSERSNLSQNSQPSPSTVETRHSSETRLTKQNTQSHKSAVNSKDMIKYVPETKRKKAGPESSGNLTACESKTKQKLSSSSESKEKSSSQSETKQKSSNSSETKQKSSSQSETKQKHSSQSETKQKSSSQSETKQKSSSQSETKQKLSKSESKQIPSSQSETKQKPSSQSETKQKSSKSEKNKQKLSKSESKQKPSSQSETKQKPSSQSETKQKSSKSEETKQKSSSQSETKQKSSSQSETKQKYSSQSETKQKYSSQSENKQKPSSQSENKQKLSSQSETEQKSSSQSETKQKPSSQSETKQKSSSQSETKQKSSKSEETKQKPSSQSETKQKSSKSEETKQKPSSQSETKQKSSKSEENKQKSSSQSETKQKSSSQSENKQKPSSQLETKQKSSSQSETKQQLSISSETSVENIENSSPMETLPSTYDIIDLTANSLPNEDMAGRSKIMKAPGFLSVVSVEQEVNSENNPHRIASQEHDIESNVKISEFSLDGSAKPGELSEENVYCSMSSEGDADSRYTTVSEFSSVTSPENKDKSDHTCHTHPLQLHSSPSLELHGTQRFEPHLDSANSGDSHNPQQSEQCGTEPFVPCGTQSLEPCDTQASELRGTQPFEHYGTRPFVPCGTQSSEQCGTQPFVPCGSQSSEPCGTQSSEPQGTQSSEPRSAELFEPHVDCIEIESSCDVSQNDSQNFISENISSPEICSFSALRESDDAAAILVSTQRVRHVRPIFHISPIKFQTSFSVGKSQRVADDSEKSSRPSVTKFQKRCLSGDQVSSVDNVSRCLDGDSASSSNVSIVQESIVEAADEEERRLAELATPSRIKTSGLPEFATPSRVKTSGLPELATHSRVKTSGLPELATPSRIKTSGVPELATPSRVKTSSLASCGKSGPRDKQLETNELSQSDKNQAEYDTSGIQTNVVSCRISRSPHKQLEKEKSCQQQLECDRARSETDVKSSRTVESDGKDDPKQRKTPYKILRRKADDLSVGLTDDDTTEEAHSCKRFKSSSGNSSEGQRVPEILQRCRELHLDKNTIARIRTMFGKIKGQESSNAVKSVDRLVNETGDVMESLKNPSSKKRSNSSSPTHEEPRAKRIAKDPDLPRDSSHQHTNEVQVSRKSSKDGNVDSRTKVQDSKITRKDSDKPCSKTSGQIKVKNSKIKKVCDKPCSSTSGQTKGQNSKIRKYSDKPSSSANNLTKIRDSKITKKKSDKSSGQTKVQNSKIKRKNSDKPGSSTRDQTQDTKRKKKNSDEHGSTVNRQTKVQNSKKPKKDSSKSGSSTSHQTKHGSHVVRSITNLPPQGFRLSNAITTPGSWIRSCFVIPNSKQMSTTLLPTLSVKPIVSQKKKSRCQEVNVPPEESIRRICSIEDLFCSNSPPEEGSSKHSTEETSMPQMAQDTCMSELLLQFTLSNAAIKMIKLRQPFKTTADTFSIPIK